MSSVVRFSNAPEIFAKADALFRVVEAQLRRVVPYAEVHHVGSTAIRRSFTKGDLDVLVRVQRSLFAAADQALAEIFERNVHSSRSDEFSAFLDASTKPELGVQLVVFDSSGDTFLKWLEKLRSDAVLRIQYDELKQSFEGKSMEAYREAKSRFIAHHLGEAS
jgi:GrpB-like predicted nucleotidyltransferase (UPF0157 family)